MGCSFLFNTTKNPIDLYNWGVSEAMNYGASYSGTPFEGDFSVQLFGGNINGTYKVTGSKIEIELNKPFFVPCALIESFLRTRIC